MPRYDQYNYPADRGAVDFQDSARLAGLMWVFDHHEKTKVDITKYYLEDPIRGWTYVRHPIEGNKYPFSRDQMSCLFGGLKAANKELFVDPNYRPDNRDLISLSVLDHISICAGGKPSVLGQFNLWIDVLWSCFVDPMAEPNQLLCMLMVHPNKNYIKFWRRWNSKWRQSIITYWCNWRDEVELAYLMIDRIEKL